MVTRRDHLSLSDGLDSVSEEFFLSLGVTDFSSPVRPERRPVARGSSSVNAPLKIFKRVSVTLFREQKGSD